MNETLPVSFKEVFLFTDLFSIQKKMRMEEEISCEDDDGGNRLVRKRMRRRMLREYRGASEVWFLCFPSVLLTKCC